MEWRNCEAYVNEEGDGWLPRHCDEDYHRDHEDILEAVIIGQFQNEMDNLQLDVNTKLSAFVRNPDDSSAGSRELSARLKLNNLKKVRNHLITCAKKDARDKHLGYYHQYPENSHYSQEILECMDRYIFVSKFTQSVEYIMVSEEVNRIRSNIAHTHKYETRWDKVARIKAEAARREAERNNN